MFRGNRVKNTLRLSILLLLVFAFSTTLAQKTNFTLKNREHKAYKIAYLEKEVYKETSVKGFYVKVEVGRGKVSSIELPSLNAADFPTSLNIVSAAPGNNIVLDYGFVDPATLGGRVCLGGGCSAPAPTIIQSGVEKNSGKTYEAKFGYAVNNFVNVELSVSTLANRTSFISTPLAVSLTEEFDSIGFGAWGAAMHLTRAYKNSARQFMLSTELFLSKKEIFSPFIILGLGAVKISEKLTQSISNIYACNQINISSHNSQLFGCVADPHPYISSTLNQQLGFNLMKTNYTPAYVIGGGIKMNLNEKVSLDFSYKTTGIFGKTPVTVKPYKHKSVSIGISINL